MFAIYLKLIIDNQWIKIQKFTTYSRKYQINFLQEIHNKYPDSPYKYFLIFFFKKIPDLFFGQFITSIKKILLNYKHT